ncbi:MAG: type II toxin-antitoxin system Phd/YefM family antitoxin [Gammaproteobacteria bacterium]
MTTKTIDVHEAQQRLVELLAQVAAGTEVILMDGPTPRARLVPVAPVTTRRVPGLHTGSITISADFNTPLSDDFWTGTR